MIGNSNNLTTNKSQSASQNANNQSGCKKQQQPQKEVVANNNNVSRLQQMNVVGRKEKLTDTQIKEELNIEGRSPCQWNKNGG